MEGNKKQKLDLESKQLILRFLRDQGGADHKAFFNKRKDVFGPEKSPHRLRAEKFFDDTKRRVYQDPVKFKALLVSLGVEKSTMPAKKKSSSSSKTNKKRHESDSDDNVEMDDVEELSEESSEDEEKTSVAFVGSPKPKGKQQQQQHKSAKKMQLRRQRQQRRQITIKKVSDDGRSEQYLLTIIHRV